MVGMKNLLLTLVLLAPAVTTAQSLDKTVVTKIKTEAYDCTGYFHALSTCMNTNDLTDTYASLSRNAANIVYRFATADSSIKLKPEQTVALEKSIAAKRSTYAANIGNRCQNARKLTAQWASTCGALVSDIEYRQRAWCAKLAPTETTYVSDTQASPKGTPPLYTTCQGLRKVNWAGGGTQSIADNYRNQRTQIIGQDVACCLRSTQRTSATTPANLR